MDDNDVYIMAAARTPIILYPLIPQRRLLELGEVAAYAIYLAGEQAKGITG